jgi:RNA polymerase sigma factor (TIGR02999 family)
VQDGQQTDVTALLNELGSGHADAAERLVPYVYDELRGLAAGYLRRERADHTLEPTALAHEAFLKLSDQTRAQWKSRPHFMAVAATVMRRILADHARRRLAGKRVGRRQRVSLSGVSDRNADEGVDLIALDDVLTRLAEKDAGLYRIVELRFFGGLTMPEVADLVGVSTPTVERHWRLARAWLSAELDPGAGDDA